MKEFRDFCLGVVGGFFASVTAVIIFGSHRPHPRWGSDEYSFILTIMLAAGALFVVLKNQKVK